MHMGSERRRIFVKEVPQVAPRRQRPINLPGAVLRVEGDGRIATVDRKARQVVIWNTDVEPVQKVILSGLPDPQPGTEFERLILLSDLTGVLLGVDQVVCLDPSGTQRWSLRHPPWPRGRIGGDVVVIDHRLVIVLPASPVLAGYGVHPIELAIVDIANGSESGREPLLDEIGDPEGFHAITRRDGHGGVLDGGYGQDGSQIWQIKLSSGRAESTPLGTFDRILADLSPSGDEFLTTPHGTGGLVLYRWNDLTEVGRLEPADVFELEAPNNDSFDFYAWFLSSDRLLALTRQGRLLLIDRRRMTVEYQIVPRGFEALGLEGEISAVTVMDEDRILVHGQAGRMELCEL